MSAPEDDLTAVAELAAEPAAVASRTGHDLSTDQPHQRRNRVIVLMLAGLVAVDLTALQFGDRFGTVVSIVGTVVLGVVFWVIHRRPASCACQAQRSQPPS